MLFRVKIVKCLDIVVESNSIEELIREYRELLETCNQESKIYIHRLSEKNGFLVDEGRLLSGIVKEVLHHRIQQRDQP